MSYSDAPIYLNSDCFQDKILHAIRSKQLELEYSNVKNEVLLLQMDEAEFKRFRELFPGAELTPAFYETFNTPTLIEFAFQDSSLFFKQIISPSRYALLRAPTNVKGLFTFYEESNDNTFTVFVNEQTITYAKTINFEVLELSRLRLLLNDQPINFAQINVKDSPQFGVRFILASGRYLLHFLKLEDMQRYFNTAVTKYAHFRVILGREESVEEFEYEGNELVTVEGVLCEELHISLCEDVGNAYGLAIEAPNQRFIRQKLQQLAIEAEITPYRLEKPLLSIEPESEQESNEDGAVLSTEQQFPLLKTSAGTSFNDLLHYLRVFKIYGYSIMLLTGAKAESLPEQLLQYRHVECGDELCFLVPDDSVAQFNVVHTLPGTEITQI